MMHTLTVQWLRKTELHVDASLASKRWQLAESYARGITKRAGVLRVVEAFVLPIVEAGQADVMTTELVGLDPEFPATSNWEALRGLATLTVASAMVNRFPSAVALCLGIRAATARGSRGDPVAPELIDEVEAFLLEESNRRRPESFDSARSGPEVDERLPQLAEEIQLLWWLLGKYSPDLRTARSKLAATAYSLVATSEAVDRVRLLPWPPNVEALVTQAIDHCKNSQKPVSFADVLSAQDQAWLKARAWRTTLADGARLLPLVTAVVQMATLGDAAAALGAAGKQSRLAGEDTKRRPSEIAARYLDEMAFLSAVNALQS